MFRKLTIILLVLSLSLVLFGQRANYTFVKERYTPGLKLTQVNTIYEELTCVGCYPDRDQLEAVIAIKKPIGYKGNLCQKGSTEYVAFYIDFGGGFKSIGAPAEVNVHDLTAAKTGPIYYAVRQNFTPEELKKCNTPQVVKVRAILSWEKIPTGPNFIPTWGNWRDTWIQIRPKPKKMVVAFRPVPFEIAPLKIAELKKVKPVVLSKEAKLYFNKLNLKRPRPQITAQIQKARNDFPKLIAKNPNYFGAISNSKSPQELKKALVALPDSKLKKTLLAKKITELKPILPLIYNIGFEQLDCVGLYPEADLLEAVIEIKRPSGYGGDLCKVGTKEYIAFYIDWGSGYQHEKTVYFNAHNIPDASTKSILYAVQAKIANITSKLKHCNTENVVKVKAILSWNTDPTPYGSNYKPAWGNVLIRKVQIRPLEDPISNCKITIVNEVHRVHISNGFAVDMDIPFPYTYDRPFGGYIVCKGDLVAAAKYYRFRYSDDNGNTWVTIKDKRRAINLITIPGMKPYKEVGPVDDDGWFSRAAYDTDKNNYESSGLVYWKSHGRNGKHLLRLEVADAGKNIIPGQSDQLALMLDNLSPVYYHFTNPYNASPIIGVALRLAGTINPSKCGEFSGNAHVEVLGNFYDEYFDVFDLSVFGGNISTSGYHVAGGPPPPNPAINQTGTVTAYDYPPANQISVLKSLFLNSIPQSPYKLKCSYFFRLRVWDKAIVGSVSGYQFNWHRHGNTAYVTFYWVP